MFVADMSDPAQIRREAAAARLGRWPSNLVNNAAVVWPLGPTAKVDPVEWEASFQINVFAVLRMTQEVLPSMLERGWGRSSTCPAGSSPIPRRWSAATPTGRQGGARGARRQPRRRARGTGVTVNAFRPGAVDTAMQGWIRDQDPAEIGTALHERFVTGYESGAS